MSLGTLQIRTRDGRTQSFVIDQPTLTVGREPDNQIVIEDPSVARRHARLAVEAGRLMVEDLGSASGTFAGNQRLAPNTPGLVGEGEVVQLGEVEVRYLPPARVAPVVQTALTRPPPASISLAGPQRAVAPGEATTATLTIQNRGPVPDEFTVRVSGIPGNWVRLSNDRVALLPDGQEQVTITFQPPRRAEAVATDHRFIISAISREHHSSVTTQGALKVLPYQGFAIGLQPVHSTRDFTLTTQNLGEAPVTYSLSADDEDHALNFGFGRPVVHLAPGESQAIPLRVTPKVKPRLGTRETHAFAVTAQSTDQTGAAEVTATGQLVIRHPVALWLIPLAILVTLGVCIGGTFAYILLCPTYSPAMPFCSAWTRPVINLLSATPPEVGPGGAVVLAWDASNAQTVELVSPVHSTLAPSGLRTFNVEQTTTFTVRARNRAGAVERSVIVRVRSDGGT